VRSNFGAKGVEEMLETNWKVWCKANEQEIEAPSSMSKKLDEILVEGGFADQRAAKLDVDDFLRLLSLLHSHGIHFT